jgi:putative ABC transport system substrate-binding protein
MRRREFIMVVGGAAAAWPLAARAQQGDRVRRIGVLMGWSESDPARAAYFSALVQELARRGWRVGGNLGVEHRWTNGDIDRARVFAKELVEMQPDVILAGTTPVTAALLRETRTIPIVFAVVSDPVGAGFIASLSHPGGNATGFINVEAAMGGKWIDLLKEIAPRIRRAAIMFNPNTAPGGGNYFLGTFEAAARSLAVEPVTVRVRSDNDIETAITSLGRDQAGLVLMTDSFIAVRQRAIISLSARNDVPVISDTASFPRSGGLISYGPNYPDMFRQAAWYVDRILRGAKPADLPVEVPIKFDLVINLKSAKALGLTVPNTLLVSAEEVIE